MRCPQCGQQITGRASCCPHCGRRLRSTGLTPERGALRPPLQDDLRPLGHTRQGCGWSFLVLFATLLAILGIVGLGLAGAYHGMKDRTTLERRAAQEHYEKGLAHFDAGELELAEAELELAVQLDSRLEAAATRLAETRQRLETSPTATPVLQAEINAITFEELRAAHNQRDWTRVFALADRLLARDPTYQRSELDRMLFDALYQSGQQLVEENRLEEAARLFDRALALQPTNADAARAKQLATLYLAAKSYWSADWAKAIESLSTLYRLDASYRDVRQLTHDAYVNYGDVLAKQGDWCAAAQQYARALEVIPAQELSAKRETALDHCDEVASATAQWGPAEPSGTFVGRIVKQTDLDDSKKMSIRGSVADREGQGVRNIKVQIRAWDWWAVSVTDAQGQYSFDGLVNPVTYTLTLFDRPCVPVNAAGVWGKTTWVDFQEAG